MDTYKLVIETRPFEGDDISGRVFREYATDTLARVVSQAHSYGYDLLSLYLIKATDCAPQSHEEGGN